MKSYSHFSIISDTTYLTKILPANFIDNNGNVLEANIHPCKNEKETDLLREVLFNAANVIVAAKNPDSWKPQDSVDLVKKFVSEISL